MSRHRLVINSLTERLGQLPGLSFLTFSCSAFPAIGPSFGIEPQTDGKLPFSD